MMCKSFAIFMCVGIGFAHATVVDLTTVGGAGTVGDALFLQWNGEATGTGNINSFAQIGANTDVTQAYNTTVNGTLDNGSSDNFNHQLLLTEIPTVTIEGVDYYEFLLDINQTGSDPLLSLDEIQVFTSGTPNQSTESFSSGILALTDATLVYDLDALENSHVLLNYSLNGGSGNGDMQMYLDVSLFDTAAQPYVYLYSLFGETENANAGFEEWAIRDTVVPEPASLLLLGIGLTSIALKRPRKNASRH